MPRLMWPPTLQIWRSASHSHPFAKKKKRKNETDVDKIHVVDYMLTSINSKFHDVMWLVAE